MVLLSIAVAPPTAIAMPMPFAIFDFIRVHFFAFHPY
mgnify:CR=1 FL=1